MKTPHKHVELIKAWADGEIIQYRNNEDWIDVREPSWIADVQYRIKSEPAQSLKWHYSNARNTGNYRRLIEIAIEIIITTTCVIMSVIAIILIINHEY